MNLNFSEFETNNKNNIFIYDEANDDKGNSNIKVIDTFEGRKNVYYNPLENKLHQQNSIFNATVKPKQKPKLTYDDMLNSMNVSVVNGVLRFGVNTDKLKNIQDNNSNNNDYNEATYNETNYNEVNYNMEYKTVNPNEAKKRVSINTESFNYSEKQKKQQKDNQKSFNEPVDPGVKNSWIYNKYFKNYKEEQQNSNEERPLTKKEFDEKIINDFLERKRAQKIAGQIKSTKLLFSNNNQIIYSSQNNNNLNKLFKFK